MTADELDKILDRLHAGLNAAGMWALREMPDLDELPGWYDDLDSVWRDLNRERALMLAEEQRIQRMRENWIVSI